MSPDEPRPSRPQRIVRLLAAALLRIAFVLLYLWCLGAIWYSEVGPAWLRIIVVAAFALGFPVMWYARRRSRTRVSQAFFLAAAVIIGLWQFKRPSNDREWVADMAAMPVAAFDGGLVHVRNIRNCNYRGVDDFDVRYYDATFDLTKLETVYFLVEPFSTYRGPAHTMLAFGFSDGRHVAISVELRREKGEAFHPLPGMYRQFELMYVVGDERDLIQLRTHHRRHEVYFYPIKATQQAKRDLFVDMLERANKLRESPEFYNVWTSSCTTNIVAHVNKLTDGPRPLNLRILLPAYADELAYEMGLIETDLPFEQAKQRFRINERARVEDGTPFSVRIRRFE